MAYTAGSLRLVNQNAIDDLGPRTWVLSGTDSDATVLAAGYITDGGILGVKKGDEVKYFKTDTPAIYIHVVTVVATTGNGALTLGSSPAAST